MTIREATVEVATMLLGTAIGLVIVLGLAYWLGRHFLVAFLGAVSGHY
jgi:hypothetical protein